MRLIFSVQVDLLKLKLVITSINHENDLGVFIFLSNTLLFVKGYIVSLSDLRALVSGVLVCYFYSLNKLFFEVYF